MFVNYLIINEAEDNIFCWVTPTSTHGKVHERVEVAQVGVMIEYGACMVDLVKK